LPQTTARVGQLSVLTQASMVIRSAYSIAGLSALKALEDAVALRGISALRPAQMPQIMALAHELGRGELHRRAWRRHQTGRNFRKPAYQRRRRYSGNRSRIGALLALRPLARQMNDERNCIGHKNPPFVCGKAATSRGKHAGKGRTRTWERGAIHGDTVKRQSRHQCFGTNR
jgi:hypothetical protein